MNARYESQSGILRDDPSEDELDQLLSDLDGVDNSYASLTAPDGSYVQAGGGPDDFTVEIRDVRPQGTFLHLKATTAPSNPEERQLTIGGESVKVRADQVLDLPTVRQIFRFFLREHRADPRISWQDMTAMFEEPS